MKTSVALIALLALAVSAIAAPQPYSITIRSGGSPATGLASQLSTAQAAYNPLTGAAVSSPGVTWAEYGTSGRYYVVGGYDAAASGPLHLNLDAGSAVTDPNERYSEIDLYADPALIASASVSASALTARSDAGALLTALLNGGHTAFTAPALANAPTGTGGGTGPTAQQVAAAVWDEPTGGHATGGTFGPFLTALPASIWSYGIDGSGGAVLSAKTALGAVFAVNASAPLISVAGAIQTTTFYHYGGATPFVVSVLGRNSSNLPVTKGVTVTPRPVEERSC